MIKIAICDDDKYICSIIEDIILEYKKNTNTSLEVEVFFSGKEFLKYIKERERFDLIFLDIELCDTTGIEIANEIRKNMEDYISKIVFITSKSGYEKQLFDTQPLNFIEKPILKDKILHSVKLTEKLNNIENNYFEFKTGVSIYKVKYSDILYFERNKRKIDLITINNRYSFYKTLNELNSILPKIFISPNNSQIINFNNTQIISKEKITMINKDEIYISQRSKSAVRKFIMEFEKDRNL